MSKLTAKAFPNCEYPVIAMHYANRWNNKKRVCEDLNITEELLDAFLNGSEKLTEEELGAFMRRIFILNDHIYHKSAFSDSHLKSPTIPYYIMNKRKHKNKVAAVKAAYEKAVAEAQRAGVYGGRVDLTHKQPSFQPLPYFGGIVLRNEVDRALSAIEWLNQQTRRIAEAKPPRGIEQRTA